MVSIETQTDEELTNHCTFEKIVEQHATDLQEERTKHAAAIKALTHKLNGVVEDLNSSNAQRFHAEAVLMSNGLYS